MILLSAILFILLGVWSRSVNSSKPCHTSQSGIGIGLYPVGIVGTQAEIAIPTDPILKQEYY